MGPETGFVTPNSGEISSSKDLMLSRPAIILSRAFASYKDGNKEAVMTYYKYKDGKVVYMETGATKLAK